MKEANAWAALVLALALGVSIGCGKSKVEQAKPTKPAENTPKSGKGAAAEKADGAKKADGTKKANGAAESAKPKSLKTPKFEIKTSEKTIPRNVAAVLAWDEAGVPGKVRVKVTSKQDATCDRMRKLWSGEIKEEMDLEALIKSKDIEVELELVRRLQLDGRFGWEISSNSVQLHSDIGMSMNSGGDAADQITLDNEGKPKDKVVSGAFAKPFTHTIAEGKVKLEVSGPFKAEFCGTKPADKDAKPTPDPKPVPEGLVWTMAGAKHPIRGATIHPKGDDVQVVLSTEPHSCAKPANSGDPTGGVLAIDMMGKERKIEHIGWPARGAYYNPGKTAFEFGALEGAKEVKLSAKGEAEFEGKKATFEGSTTALVCPPKAP